MNKKWIKKNLEYIYLIASILVAFLVGNETKFLPVIGWAIIWMTIFCCLKVKNETMLLLIIAVIAVSNLSLAYTDCIKKGLYVIPWQINLRQTQYSVIMAKCVLISTAMFNCFINYVDKKNTFQIQRKKNLFIFAGGYGFLWYIMLYGIGEEIKAVNAYVSNGNTLYEYAIIITFVVWYYGNNKTLDFMIKLYGICFVIQSFIYGDRSAGVLMILLLFVIYGRMKLNLFKIIVVALAGILLLNFLIVYRVNRQQPVKEIITKTADRGLYLDTVSYCYYAGMTICALNDYEENKINMFVQFCKSIYEGSSRNEYAEISKYVTKQYSGLQNRGGGLYASLFYAWGGYLGVIVSNLLIGVLFIHVFNGKGTLCNMYRVLLTVYTFRWYLYNVFNIFRSILFVFTILYISCVLFDFIIKKNFKLYLKVPVRRIG